jgi:hypothetical protein
MEEKATEKYNFLVIKYFYIYLSYIKKLLTYSLIYKRL